MYRDGQGRTVAVAKTTTQEFAVFALIGDATGASWRPVNGTVYSKADTAQEHLDRMARRRGWRVETRTVESLTRRAHDLRDDADADVDRTADDGDNGAT